MSPARRNNMLPTELPSVFRRSHAHSAGVSDRRLRRLVEDGIVERIGRGVYRRADAQPADMGLLEIAAATRRATLCLGSALATHGLVNLIPPAIDLALPRNVRRPQVAAPVHWHTFSLDTFELGRDALEVGDGLSLGIYSSERSICDAYRMRHLEGDELGREALRAWLRHPGSQPSTLLHMAESFPKARSALRQDLQVLL